MNTPKACDMCGASGPLEPFVWHDAKEILRGGALGDCAFALHERGQAHLTVSHAA